MHSIGAEIADQEFTACEDDLMRVRIVLPLRDRTAARERHQIETLAQPAALVNGEAADRAES